MRDIKSHKRVNNILLAPLERPALQWFAAHMPAWVNPDILTAIGMAGSVLIFFSYWLTNIDKNFLWLASLGFVINWFGDSMDGTLARYRNAQRPRYGFFVDHTFDALSQVLVFMGLGLSPYVKFEVASLALTGYLLMSILVYVSTCVNGVFRISFLGVGPTEFRLVAILANTFVFFFGNMLLQFYWGSISLFDLVGVAAAILLIGAFILTTLRQANELARLEKK